MYFNYHARIKRKINEGLLLRYEMAEEYNGIAPALVLYFCDGTVYPVRESRFLEYLELLNQKNCKK